MQFANFSSDKKAGWVKRRHKGNTEHPGEGALPAALSSPW